MSEPKAAGYAHMLIESAECPYCHRTFYALLLHDPLKRHMPFCEDRPESGDDDE